MPSLTRLTEEALSLAVTVNGGPSDPDQLVAQLCAGAGRDDLEEARQQLLRRIYARSDDYQATGALQLVNRALAKVGWQDPYSWKHRRKP